MDAVITAADRIDGWVVSDEIYREGEIGTVTTSPTMWGGTRRWS
jgi:hypothetical protein